MTSKCPPSSLAAVNQHNGRAKCDGWVRVVICSPKHRRRSVSAAKVKMRDVEITPTLLLQSRS